jgi:hypothetical protein
MTAVELAYISGGLLIAIPLAIFAVVFARRALVDMFDTEPAVPSWNVATPLPYYPPMDDDTAVLTGAVLAVDELGEWEPNAYQLADAYVFDDVRERMPWLQLREPVAA